MGDPILNCLTAVCCPPEAQRRLLAKTVAEKCGLSSEQGAKVADYMLGNFDLAPHGTMAPLISAITDLARGEPYKE